MRAREYMNGHTTAGFYHCACFRRDDDFMVVKNGVVQHVVLNSDDFMNALYDAITVHGDSLGRVDDSMIDYLKVNRCGCAECPLFSECELMNEDI